MASGEDVNAIVSSSAKIKVSDEKDLFKKPFKNATTMCLDCGAQASIKHLCYSCGSADVVWIRNNILTPEGEDPKLRHAHIVHSIHERLFLNPTTACLTELVLEVEDVLYLRRYKHSIWGWSRKHLKELNIRINKNGKGVVR